MSAQGSAATGDSPPTHELQHQPALDGLRGLAVIAVLAYHLGGGAVPGGFLGVSLFFTLSGFLITNVVLSAAERSGRVDMLGFWKRRLLRLLPAAIIGIGLAVVLTYYYGTADQVGRLRGDVAASLGYVQNWHQIVVGDVYGAVYKQPSSLQHFWSLAIEEQFYVVYPLLAWALVRWRASRRTWLTVLGALTVMSLAAQLLADHTDINRIYLGSDTRASEILIGGLLAVAIRMRPPSAVRSLARRRWSTAVFAVPVLAMVVLWVWTHQTDAWLYRGGLVVVALVSAAVLVVALTPGPFARLMSWRPLRWMGTISYGVYLYHWPIFIALTARHPRMGRWPLAAICVVLTLVMASLSAYLVELPIRRGRFVLRRRVVRVPRHVLAGTIPFVLVGLLWGATVAEARAETRAVDMRAASRIQTQVTAAPPAITASSTTTTTVPVTTSTAKSPGDVITPTTTSTAPSTTSPPAPPPVRRVLFMGDSLVHQSLPGIAKVFADRGIEVQAVGGAGQTMLSHRDEWLDQLASSVQSFNPDVVVLEACCGYGPSAFRAAYRAPDGRRLALDSRELYVEWTTVAEQASTIAAANGALPMWVLAPPARPGNFYGKIDQRIPIVNQIYSTLAACAAEIGVVDWRVLAAADGSYTDSLPALDGTPIPVRNADGLHFTPAGVGVIANTTLAAIDAAWDASAGRRPLSVDLATSCAPDTLVP